MSDAIIVPPAALPPLRATSFARRLLHRARALPVRAASITRNSIAALPRFVRDAPTPRLPCLADLETIQNLSRRRAALTQ